MNWHDYINLPRLDIDGHKWTMQGQVLKMLEELGEVSQALNKDRDLEKTAAETLDFIMTGVTLLNILEAREIDVDKQFGLFVDKLDRKQYLVRVAREGTKANRNYERLGQQVGQLVDIKNSQYGDAFNKSGEILAVLYPEGVKPEQYRDMLAVIRVIDKLFRVANGKQGSEDPWEDIAGYGLLGMEG